MLVRSGARGTWNLSSVPCAWSSISTLASSTLRAVGRGRLTLDPDTCRQSPFRKLGRITGVGMSEYPPELFKLSDVDLASIQPLSVPAEYLLTGDSPAPLVPAALPRRVGGRLPAGL